MRQVVFPKFFIVSASKDHLSTMENHRRTREVFDLLNTFKVDFCCVTGVYKGVEEQSFLLFDSEGVEDKVKTIAKMYGLDCYLKRDTDNQGYYCFEGEEKSLGVAVEVTSQEARELESFTILPQKDNTKKYFTFKGVQ